MLGVIIYTTEISLHQHALLSYLPALVSLNCLSITTRAPMVLFVAQVCSDLHGACCGECGLAEMSKMSAIAIAPCWSLCVPLDPSRFISVVAFWRRAIGSQRDVCRRS